jgi:hypothetical protein
MMASLGVFWAAVMVAACSSCKKGSDTTTLGFSKCIEDWPTSGGPHPITASLQVEAPKLLWAIDVAGSQAMSVRISSGDGGPVLAGNRLAFQAGDFVYFVNKDGSDPQQARLASSGYPSGLAADLAGNVYTVAQDGVFSIDAAGKMRWQGGGAGQTQGELTYYNPCSGPTVWSTRWRPTSACTHFAPQTEVPYGHSRRRPWGYSDHRHWVVPGQGCSSR